MHRERLPSRMTVTEFQEKFEHLKPGQGFIYHSGLLGEDRQDDPRLDRLAEHALILGTDRDQLVYVPQDKKEKTARVGTGRALLMQKRNCSGHEYLILKRRTHH